MISPRRPGDPAKVVASAEKITSVLGWKARHDVRAMVTSAWAGWEANKAAKAAAHKDRHKDVHAV